MKNQKIETLAGSTIFACTNLIIDGIWIQRLKIQYWRNGTPIFME